jgi:hypothetical protein
MLKVVMGKNAMVKKIKKKSVDLKKIFLGLQAEMVAKLRNSRINVKHPTAKGNVTENSWRRMLETYLPKRYAVESAFVIDSHGNISEQIDLVIFDRHFSPFLFHEEGAIYIPAESVYAVFEIKQEASNANLSYAAKKVKSVRKLTRTSATITHAGGKFSPIVPKEILAGFLALTNAGNQTSLQPSFIDNLGKLPQEERIDLVCVLERGAASLSFPENGSLEVQVFSSEQALINFFLSLLSKLQAIGSVPAMDIKAYWDSLTS